MVRYARFHKKFFSTEEVTLKFTHNYPNLLGFIMRNCIYVVPQKFVMIIRISLIIYVTSRQAHASDTNSNKTVTFGAKSSIYGRSFTYYY